jgi:hypothetical protein
MKTRLTLLLLLAGTIAINAQQYHFKNTVNYLAKANVSGRTTWNMNDTVQLISIDQYDANGNKTEAYEFYYGKRLLRKNTDKGWEDQKDTTHYSFIYDSKGFQTKQIFHNFPNKQTDSYHMFKYDRFGNIERWGTGRSYQLAHVEYFTYDGNGSVVQESSCWDDTCENQMPLDKVWATTSKHYLKYNSKKMVIEDLVNYMDGMSGYQYAYTFNQSGQLINIKQSIVWSYFGLDHEIPTSKDIDRTKPYQEWKFEYNANGQLYKETRIDHWTESQLNTYTFIYNDLGLITESISGWDVIIKYTYNDKGLVEEEKHYARFDNKDELRTTLKFEYAYRY